MEGEGLATVIIDDNPLDRIIPDPFGIVNIDLNAVQAIHAAEGKFMRSNIYFILFFLFFLML
jgi:hypothetical protein